MSRIKNCLEVSILFDKLKDFYLSTGTNPFLEMAKLRSDVKKHKEEQKLAQKSMEANTEEEPEDAWYKDESDEFQKNLKEYHHR